MLKLNTVQFAKIVRCFLSFLIFAIPSFHASAQAENDFDQPIRVTSDEQFVDAKLKTSTFEKNVQINQGSLAIIADYVKVDASKGKGKEIFTIRGEPASYTQMLADGSNVEAKANQIVYDIGTRSISLEGNAELLQNASTVRGDSIIFDMEREQMRAQGNGESTEQVETIFTPESLPDDQN